MYERIVVPLDGSELAERALPTAEGMVRLTGASLHLVRVLDFASMQRVGAYGLAVEYAAVQGVLEEEEAAARGYLALKERELSGRGFAVTVALPGGVAAHALAALAKPGDLIVMASHGRGGMARWFLGSVAEEVARHAPVPVLLVRVAAPTTGATTTASPAAVTGTDSG